MVYDYTILLEPAKTKKNEKQRNNFYRVMDKASGRLHERWRHTDLRSEYHLKKFLFYLLKGRLY